MQQKWNQNFDGEPMTDIPQKFLNAGCDVYMVMQLDVYKRQPTDHPGYDEYQYHLDEITHDPWQLTSFLTTLYDDYTRSEVQGKLTETFKKQYKLTTWSVS